jgi:hypothetical protein
VPDDDQATPPADAPGRTVRRTLRLAGDDPGAGDGEQAPSSRPIVFAVVAGAVTVVLLAALWVVLGGGKGPASAAAEATDAAPAAETAPPPVSDRAPASPEGSPFAAPPSMPAPVSPPAEPPPAPPIAQPAPAPPPPPPPPVAQPAPAPPPPAPPVAQPAPAPPPPAPPVAQRAVFVDDLVVGRQRRLAGVTGTLIVQAIDPDGKADGPEVVALAGERSVVAVGPFLQVELGSGGGGTDLVATVIDEARLSALVGRLVDRITALERERAGQPDAARAARIAEELRTLGRDNADALGARKQRDGAKPWSVRISTRAGEQVARSAIRFPRVSR